ncbi:MAG: hypothetical protein JXB00_17990 [Bacteroidales bacterium]|nr:hypothetical protein [Bacteroidales bacterium]
MKHFYFPALIIPVQIIIIQAAYCQITYNYYKNPNKIGSPNPEATANFIKSFEFIMQWSGEDTDSAIYFMQKAIQEDSLYAIAYASLGHMIKYGGYNGSSVDKDSIAKLAEIALKINPVCGDAHTLMSWVHYMDANYQQAIESCKKAVEAEPDHRETWLWLGVRYTHMPEKLDSAIDAFNKSLEADSLFGQPHQKLGWIYLYYKPDYEKAAYHFRKMVCLFEETEPRDERMIIGYYGLGEALLKMKKPGHALDTFNLLLKKCNNSTINWLDNLLSWTYSGITRCHLMQADSVTNLFIAHNLATQENHPGDIGIKLNIIEEFEGFSYQLKEFNFSDTLKQLRMPLCEQVLSNATDDYEINRAIESKILLFQEGKEYQEAEAALKQFLVEYSGKNHIKSTICYLQACNYASMDKINKALKCLAKSVKRGFNDFYRINNEPAFIKLRNHRRFLKAVNDN